MTNRVLFLVAGLFLLTGTGVTQECRLSIDNVECSWGPNAILAGYQTGLSIRVTATCDITGNYNVSNGLRLYSPDGAHMIVTTDIAEPWRHLFDYYGMNVTNDPYGEYAVVWITGTALDPLEGLPVGSDEVIGTIWIETLVSDMGKYICIDSTFVPPAGTWRWSSLSGGPDVLPDWYNVP
ncbi:MAG: hypothetical protein KKA42_07925, partial [candidate division Zixibacteria bacterium]|nr:hypothetical protein [candidate division Zixibacteria bacterium]